MQIDSKTSRHLADEELIAQLYIAEATESGDEPGYIAHLQACTLCGSKLEAMKARHTEIVGKSGDCSNVSPAFLAEQRKRIYNRLAVPQSWWQVHSLLRWASAGTAAAALGAGLVVFTGYHPATTRENTISDAQLAQEVSVMSLDSEAKSTAPLKALFE